MSQQVAVYPRNAVPVNTHNFHSGQTTEHARDLSTSGGLSVTLPVTFPGWSALSNSSTSTRYGTNCASVCE